MCAAGASRRGRAVLILDHAKKAAEKIRISGGGRCNFTNLDVRPENFLSDNPRFCISALKRFTPEDFIKLVEKYGIEYHEKTKGQLFCDTTSWRIIDLLMLETTTAMLQTGTAVKKVRQTNDGFLLKTSEGDIQCASLVIASGGLSIPKIGASDFGYRLAKQFGLNIIPTRPGLVPLTFDDALCAKSRKLAGISVAATVRCDKTAFHDDLLFTHRGLSGPAILQISSYWSEGREIRLDLAPGTDVFDRLKDAKNKTPKQEPETVLADFLPKRLAHFLTTQCDLSGHLADLPDKRLKRLADHVNDWRILPKGTEGYRTAEVTVGGIDTRELSSKTFEAKKAPGLYFIGEVVDVTGHLGGYNFQWAWASGHAAGEVV